MGYKEDIVVNQYNGRTEYSFLLNTYGLSLENEDDFYYLTNDQGECCATFGNILVMTADERNNTLGSMTAQTLLARQLYRITIHLDDEYLCAPETAYPIRIDPTIELTSAASSNPIQDVTVRESGAYAGAYNVLYVGVDSSIKKNRTIMNFPGLSVSGKNVTSAKVQLRDLMCESVSFKMQCYEYTGSAWSESTALTWANMSQYGDLLDEQYIKYGNGNATSSDSQRYAFDITNVVQKWSLGQGSVSQGILFKGEASLEASTSKNNRCFGSFNASSYQPSLIATYVSPRGINSNYSSNSYSLGDHVTIYAGHKYGTALVNYQMPLSLGDFPLEVTMSYNNKSSSSD